MEEARRTTFGVQVTGRSQCRRRSALTARPRCTSSRTSRACFASIISAKNGGTVAVVDSLAGTAEGDIKFKTMLR